MQSPLLLAVSAICLLGTASAAVQEPACGAMDDVALDFQTKPGITPRAALLIPKIDDIIKKIATNFTMCFWMTANRTTGNDVDFVSYYSKATKNDNEIELLMNFNASYTVLIIGKEKTLIKVVPENKPWNHVCFSWTAKLGDVTLYFDGRIAGRKKGKTDYKIGDKGFFVLGQDQDAEDDRYDDTTGLKGQITQFQVFDYELYEDKVAKVMKGEEKGNMVQWESTRWMLSPTLKFVRSTAPINGQTSGSTSGTGSSSGSTSGDTSGSTPGTGSSSESTSGDTSGSTPGSGSTSGSSSGSTSGAASEGTCMRW